MWQGIIGHDDVAERFRRTLAAGRLASTYLFVGPAGVGKRLFALELAHALLCTEAAEAALQPCGRCDSCRMFAAGNHPDLEVIGLPADKSTLPIALFIGDDEHRNQEGLCHRLGLRPFFGRRKVAIVDDADHFSIASANCLLKTLEEPPPNALLILIGTSPSRQLPTIRSRSQVVRFRTLATNDVACILLARGTVTNEALARSVAKLSAGSLEAAVRLTDTAVWEFRNQLLAALQSARLDGVRLARFIQAFVDEAGKEASERRERLRLVVGFAIDFYQFRMRSLAPHGADAVLCALEACLSALDQIDRNGNLGLIIQSCCERLAGERRLAPAGAFEFGTIPH